VELVRPIIGGMTKSENDSAGEAALHSVPPDRQTQFETQPGRPIDITSWLLDEDFPIHPVGSKPKRVVTCPLTNAPFLISGHSYLFKIAKDRRATQMWSEVIAYRIAALVGLDVPPCFVAVNETTGEVGALVEFFFGYPNEPQPSRLVHAADLLQRFRTGPRTDRPHFVRMNLQIGRALKIDDVDWWARALTFDALIGNTDRHPENWGWLVRRPESGEVEWRLAPIFDNGTSLGWEIQEDKLARATDPSRIARYIRAGRHHVGWDRLTDSPTPHLELCHLFAQAYPAARAAMQQVIDFESTRIAPILEECAQLIVGVPFTPDRVRFVLALIEARKHELSAIMGA